MQEICWSGGKRWEPYRTWKSKVGRLLDVAFKQGFIHMKLFCPADWITNFYYVKVSKYVVFSGLYFPLFRLKSEIYRVNLRIQFENGKIQTRKIPNLDTFTQCTSSFKDVLSGLRQFLAPESSLKMMKNAFYSTSKTLFVLKIFMFLSWLFGHVSKRLD